MRRIFKFQSREKVGRAHVEFIIMNTAGGLASLHFFPSLDQFFFLYWNRVQHAMNTANAFKFQNMFSQMVTHLTFGGDD